MTPYIQVISTVPDQGTAEQIATSLLEQRLAACVQISPCRSWYHWQGAIAQDDELRLTIKSRHTLFAALCKAIRALHPYEVPEILATPILDGGASYLAWLDQELIITQKDTK
jgi:periplasmic divalent cation tolerance protein